MSGRPLKYPYTTGAQFMQFPWKFYWNNNWVFRAYVYGLLITFPIMAKITQVSMGSGKQAPKKDPHHH